MLSITKFLQQAFDHQASDIHLTVGVPPMFRIDGSLIPDSGRLLTPADTLALAQKIMSPAQWEQYLQLGELDFSFSLAKLGRFRVNAFKQQGHHALAIRIIASDPPTLEQLGLPGILTGLVRKTKGLVLVTGPSGGGKSTTLAALVDNINRVRSTHIITLEEPIEFVHRHQKSIVNQRQVGVDTESFATGLRAALREDPDVILIGEMRDLETISTAVTAAETGHLVLSSLHTTGASQTVDRIVDVFPPHQQNQIKLQLSNVLVSIVCQQLIPRRQGPGRVLAQEILMATPAIRNLIREGDTHQINSMLQIGAQHGMITMDQALSNLYRQGLISYQQAQAHANDPKSITS
ncbi:MAG TPA: type IV pilus twitching motility protein PilT [bacterium]|nr:type IV pilus twitching motility protein PilT [bacterium]